jgi:hypothetical protein
MGDTPGHIGEVDSSRFAGFEFGRVPVGLVPRGWFNMASPRDGVPHSQGSWPRTTRPCITTASGLTRWMA